MGSHRKRSHDEYEADNRLGVGETLARLNGDAATSKPAAGDNREPDGVGDDRQQQHQQQQQQGGVGNWQLAESKQAKKRKKKQSNNYPDIWHSSHARLQSFVKISDLQNLVLYLLADGNAPQWVSVKHHTNFKKVVVLIVPGLEAGMFDGSIPLSPIDDQNGANGDAVAGRTAVDDGDASAPVSAPTNPSRPSHPPVPLFQPATSRKPRSPDEYYPIKLHHSQLSEPLQPLAEIFEHIWPIKTPGDDKHAKMHSPLASMLTAPIVKTKADKCQDRNFKGPKTPAEAKGWRNRSTPVTEFVATTEELREEGYVLHPVHFADDAKAAEMELAQRKSDRKTETYGWLDTPSTPTPAPVPDTGTENDAIPQDHHVLALDCEMCITSPVGQSPPTFSLTRCSVIDWSGATVLDELVKPEEPITDYLTPYSGITEKLLENTTTSLADIQRRLLSLITPNTILVGHGLNSDLLALKLTHPHILDTALLFPHPRGPPLKSSLKWLAQKYLQREIQRGHGSTGHDSVEDARACLGLVKQKCEKGKLWGTSEASGESLFKRLARNARPKRDRVSAVGEEDEYRTGAVVDWGDPSKGFGGLAAVAIGCESDEQVVTGVKRALGESSEHMDKSDSADPSAGVDFVWARLRELEAHRGWWNHSKQLSAQTLLSSTAETNGTSPSTLATVVAKTTARIREIYAALPPCTAFIVYSGSGDPRPLAAMQDLQRRFKAEYKVKKWDQLSVKWTDDEEQKLRRACEQARKGLGFIAVK